MGNNQVPISLLSNGSSSNPTFWDLEMLMTGSEELSQRTWRKSHGLQEGSLSAYRHAYQSEVLLPKWAALLA